MEKFLFVVLFIFKIVVIIIAPIVLFILRKRKFQKYFLWAEVSALILVTILYLIGFPYIVDSNINTIMKINLLSTSSENVNKDTDKQEKNIKKITNYVTVKSTKKYYIKEDRNAYYYSINTKPLSKVKISCDIDYYMSSYGDGISALTTLIANHYNFNVNMSDLISHLDDANLINCETGIDFDSAAKEMTKQYKGNIKQIAKTDIDKYLELGESVLVETKNIYTESNNFGCEKDYIVIYNKTNEGEYNIINPNDKDIPYYCPSNTIGYGSIIEENQNDRSFTFSEIDSKATRYFVFEVR